MCSIQLESLLNLVEMPWEGDRLLAIPSNEVEAGFQPGWRTISHRRSRAFEEPPPLLFLRATLFTVIFHLLNFYLDLYMLYVHMQKSQAAQAQENEPTRCFSNLLHLL